MRLIDADALIQKLREMKAKEEQYIGLENDVSVTIGSIGFEVMNMPTAYDIDKVVKELKDLGAKYCTNVGCEDECKDCSHGILMQKAIEIVKQGVR